MKANGKTAWLAGIVLAWAATSTVAAELQVQDARVRETLPGQTVSAAYLTVLNNGPADAVLVSVESRRVPQVELHSLHDDNGTVQMRREDRLSVPAGSHLVLEPGGLHLMLMALPKPLRVGETVDLNLVFEDGRRLAVEAPVKSLQDTLPGKSASQHHHHGHH